MDSKDLGIKDGFAKTRSHGRIHYRELGRGDPLILMHTNGGSAYQHDPVAPLLAGRFRMISWTMPGHGDSDPLARHYSIEDHAAVLAEFMDALDIRRAHVGGSSVGGSITAAFASQYADRTLSAMLIETPCRTFDEWGARWGHTEGNFGLPTQNEDQVKERVANVDAALLQRWNIDRNKAGAKAMVGVMWAIREFDVKTAASKVKRPAVILYGKRGPTIADQERFRAVAPNIPIRYFENSGHFPMYDEPAVFAKVVTEFCTQQTQPA
ncbi:MAG: alpha/beta hydrolase [Betaproteobacteria bacterium]|jgi:3-oxoadipate enol-lactonase|nr:alpha/beta hydrolase [Betaproteobacteria bacterium]